MPLYLTFSQISTYSHWYCFRACWWRACRPWIHWSCFKTCMGCAPQLSDVGAEICPNHAWRLVDASMTFSRPRQLFAYTHVYSSSVCCANITVFRLTRWMVSMHMLLCLVTASSLASSCVCCFVCRESLSMAHDDQVSRAVVMLALALGWLMLCTRDRHGTTAWSLVLTGTSVL